MQFKTCAKCGESHPLKQFTYLATYAQSKAWGRAGNVRMEIISKLCRNCRPKRKPVSRLTKKEMHNKVQSGDMNAFIAKQEVAKEAAEARRLKEDEERRLEVARVAMLEARARYKVSGAAPGMMTSMLDTQDYPTEKQIRYLKWIRLSFNEKLMTKQQASKLISMHKFSSSLTKIQNEVDKWELKRLKKL